MREGDIVTIEEICDGMCRGSTEDGRVGFFPKDYVELIEDRTVSQDLDEPDQSPYKNSEYYPTNHYVEATSLNYTEQQNSLNFPCTDQPPSFYDLYPELRKEPSTSNVEDNAQEDVPHPLGTQPYAITLYPFTAQYLNELSFKTGELVILKDYVNQHWLEGSIGDKSGIFPISYVEVVVDLPRKESATEKQVPAATENLALEPGTMMRVEYTYTAQMAGDLSVVEDEFVTLVEVVNDDWVTVKNATGDTGICPKEYLTVKPKGEEDFVELRNRNANDVKDNASADRLSEPHRPAPPAPAPDRTPLHADNSKDKNAFQRQNVIGELVLTEKDYVKDLKMTYEVFSLYDPTVLESRGVDVKVLFGNLEEIMHVAEDFLDAILRAMKGRDEESQTIGPCFVEFSDKLFNVYKKYCGNHTAALELLKKVRMKITIDGRLKLQICFVAVRR